MKLNIGIYGRTNVGKSSLLNLLTGQSVAIVSPEAGTTTDPVRRSFEILDFAPVVFIDTAGFDDPTELATQRLEKTMATLDVVDLALVLTDVEVTPDERDFFEMLDGRAIPYLRLRRDELDPPRIIEQIKLAIPESSLVRASFYGGRIVAGDVVMLVCPIDDEAPSGRLILPQVQAIRAALDEAAIAITVQPEQIEAVLSTVTPRLVVIDSQAFGTVRGRIPAHIELTSFSILLSELKGDVTVYRRGLEQVAQLRDRDRVLILENCSHQSGCNDIGRVKIPHLLRSVTGAELEFDNVNGRDSMPSDLTPWSLIVQCGGCMTTRRVIQSRIAAARRQGVPMTNYGMLLRELDRVTAAGGLVLSD